MYFRGLNMVWTKVLTILKYIYEVVKFFINSKKGQTNFCGIRLINAKVNFYNTNNTIEEITIKNINKISFDEREKTVTLISDLGMFSFNIEKIQCLEFKDVNVLTQNIIGNP